MLKDRALMDLVLMHVVLMDVMLMHIVRMDVVLTVAVPRRWM